MGEGEEGGGGWVVKREIVVNRTSEGERTLNTKIQVIADCKQDRMVKCHACPPA
jgi:hypothetical protein